MGLDYPGEEGPRDPPNPKVAGARANSSGVSKGVAALLILSQLQGVTRQSTLAEMSLHSVEEFGMGVLWGFGMFVGWRLGERCERTLRRWTRGGALHGPRRFQLSASLQCLPPWTWRGSDRVKVSGSQAHPSRNAPAM